MRSVLLFNLLMNLVITGNACCFKQAGIERDVGGCEGETFADKTQLDGGFRRTKTNVLYI